MAAIALANAALIAARPVAIHAAREVAKVAGWSALVGLSVFGSMSAVSLADRAHRRLFHGKSRKEARLEAELDFAEMDAEQLRNRNARLTRENAALRADVEYQSWQAAPAASQTNVTPIPLKDAA